MELNLITSSLTRPFSSPFPSRSLASHLIVGTLYLKKNEIQVCYFSRNIENRSLCTGKQWERRELPCEVDSRRRGFMLFFIASGLLPVFSAAAKTKSKNPYDERRLLEQNKRIQEANNAPENFPNFVREGFQVQVVTSDRYIKCDSGLIYLDIKAGEGDSPKEGQQVTFHYIGYNESGRRIDSTYLQGSPAKIRVGTKALVPGFEEGIKDMKPGGKRRIIIPPELGPPVGPSTFFSAKQFEVFDVEMLSVQDCQRRTIGFYSDLVCN